MDQWLECQISRGMFSNEYAVMGKQYDGRGFSLFAMADDVQVKNLPNGAPVPGVLRVQPLKSDNELVLVALPQPSLEGGSTVTVNANQLHPAGR